MERWQTLNINQIPSHSHYYGYVQLSQANDFDRTYSNPGIVGGSSARVATEGAGGGQAHNNMPPYLVVNMWKRIA